MTLTIDAHQHFWQLSRPFDYRWLDAPTHAPIRRDYLPEDLEPLIREVGVDRRVRRAKKSARCGSQPSGLTVMSTVSPGRADSISAALPTLIATAMFPYASS